MVDKHISGHLKSSLLSDHVGSFWDHLFICFIAFSSMLVGGKLNARDTLGKSTDLKNISLSCVLLCLTWKTVYLISVLGSLEDGLHHIVKYLSLFLLLFVCRVKSLFLDRTSEMK